MLPSHPFIPSYFHLWHLPAVFLAGMIGEGYATVIGGGGALIQFVLAALGMPLASVVATDLAGCLGAIAGIVSAVVSPQAMLKKRKVLLLLMAPLFLGGVIGTVFLVYIPVVALKYVLIVGLSLLLLYMLVGRQAAFHTLESLHIDPKRYPIIAAVLLVLGLYRNVSGVGSGTFTRLAFIGLLRMSVVESIGLASVIVVPAALFSFIATAMAGLIVWPYCFALWLGMFIGGRYVAKFARRIPDRYLNRLLVVVVSFYLVWLLVG